MKRLALGVVAFLAVAVCTNLCSAAGIEIVQYGVFTTEEVSPSTGDYEAMKSATVTSVCHVMTTSIVPVGGGEFGFRYRVLGSPVGTPVDITRVLKYPDPRTPRTTSVSYVTNTEHVRLLTGSFDYYGWKNRRSYLGVWTFQIWEKDRMLGEAVFTVVDKDAFHIRPDGSSNCFPISSLEGVMPWRWT